MRMTLEQIAELSERRNMALEMRTYWQRKPAFAAKWEAYAEKLKGRIRAEIETRKAFADLKPESRAALAIYDWIAYIERELTP